MSFPLSGPGYIYFAGHETIGPIKIGASADPWQRVRDLRTGSPIWLVLQGLMPVENMGGEERRLHGRFAAVRSHGEWFERTPDLLRVIASCRSGLLRQERLRPLRGEPVEELPDGVHTLRQASEILGRSLKSLQLRVDRTKPERHGKVGQSYLYRLSDLA